MEKDAQLKRDRNKRILMDIRREQLTAAAYKVVSKKGYNNFTIADIAHEAGLSVGLVHYYFKNKQELLLHVFKETQKNVRRNLAAELEKASDPRGKLEIFIDQSFLLFQREKDYFFLLFEFWTEINRNNTIKKMVRRLYQAYREELSVILKKGIEEKIFAEMDIQYTTTLCVSIVQHTIIQHLIDDTAFDFNEYAGRMKTFIMETILRRAHAMDGYPIPR
ncbi:MAG: TetR family transcriptional regulator [Eubacteriales bacterium]|jgi:AcrR family transcriptional regulator|nr:TetR family transcriptional regulator [Eubacteriales bacterium]MDD3847489.1 TetR family transcriptional regulator [Syntrophorhabdaceae bacterium]